jgi:hypothetical protein
MKDVAEKITASQEARRKELRILTQKRSGQIGRAMLTFGYIYVKAGCKHVVILSSYVMLFNILDRLRKQSIKPTRPPQPYPSYG